MIERAVILENTPEIRPESLPDFQLEARLRKDTGVAILSSQSLDDYMANYEREVILSCLEQNRFSLTKTSEQLKISRHALRYRMQRLNISAENTYEEEPTATSGRETQ